MRVPYFLCIRACSEAFKRTPHAREFDNWHATTRSGNNRLVRQEKSSEWCIKNGVECQKVVTKLLLPSHELELMTQAVVDVCQSASISYCPKYLLRART